MDIRRKAWAGMIDILPQKNNILLRLPSPYSPFVQTFPTEDRNSLETVVYTDVDKSRKPVSLDETGFMARYMEKAAMIYTSSESSKAKSAEMEAAKGKDRLKARKRTKTGCLSKQVFWVYISCEWLIFIACRKRRIKCGEERPACLNCIKFLRTCEGYTPRVIFKHPHVSAPGPDMKGKRTDLQNIEEYISPVGTGFSSSFGVEHPGWLHFTMPLGSSPFQALPLSSGSNTNLPLPYYHRPPRNDQLTPKQPSSDANEDFLQQPPQKHIASLSLSGMIQTDETKSQIHEQAVEPWPSNELGRDDTLSNEKLSKGHPAIRSTINQTNPDSPFYTTSLSKPSIFPACQLTHMASLKKDSSATPIFCHFVTTIGPSLSIFERHFTNPEAFLEGTAIPMPQQALWTYILPTAALTNQALLHAMLALASLHMEKLNLTSIQTSLKYYSLALGRLAESIQNITERTDLGTIAAALLLGYFEATTAEYGKWTNHLLGVRRLFLELDIKQMAKRMKGDKKKAGSATNLNR